MRGSREISLVSTDALIKLCIQPQPHLLFLLFSSEATLLQYARSGSNNARVLIIFVLVSLPIIYLLQQSNIMSKSKM